LQGEGMLCAEPLCPYFYRMNV